MKTFSVFTAVRSRRLTISSDNIKYEDRYLHNRSRDKLVLWYSRLQCFYLHSCCIRLNTLFLLLLLSPCRDKQLEKPVGGRERETVKGITNTFLRLAIIYRQRAILHYSKRLNFTSTNSGWLSAKEKVTGNTPSWNNETTYKFCTFHYCTTEIKEANYKITHNTIRKSHNNNGLQRLKSHNLK